MTTEKHKQTNKQTGSFNERTGSLAKSE